MRQYLIELSNYYILFFMILYTGISVLYFFCKKEHKKKVVYFFQNFLMLLVQFSCFLTLTLVSGDYRYLFFFAIIQLYLFAVIFFVTLIFDKTNRFLLNQMCMLLGIGLCMISRLSGIGTQTRILQSKALRQYVIVAFSLILALLVMGLICKCRILRKLTWVYALLGIAALSVVLLLGSTTLGSKISYSVFGVSFQPSEFVKILYLFFLAGILWKKPSFGNLTLSALIAGAHVLILVLSKDLGSAAVFFAAYVMVVFVASGNILYLFLGCIGGGAASYAAYRFFDHVRVRVLAWWDPWNYIDDQGYQVTQSLFAIGSGNWFGMGLLKGNPKAIPFVDVDMIFSSVCEELGVLFGVCLILVCVFCFLEMMRISARMEDRFFRLIVYGIGIMYIFQIFLTVGGGIKFIPLTGVTLPFVSYGGSSVMTSMLMFAVVQAVNVRLCEQEIEQKTEREMAVVMPEEGNGEIDIEIDIEKEAEYDAENEADHKEDPGEVHTERP